MASLIGVLALAGLLAACQAGPGTPAVSSSEVTPAFTRLPATTTPAPSATASRQPPTTVAPRPTATPSPVPSPSPTATVPAQVLREAPDAILPAGFSILKFADLYQPTGLAFGPGGDLYATSFDGTVHRFVDADQDGRAEEDIRFAYGFDTPLGVAIAPDETVYVSSKGKITRLRDGNGDRVADDVEPFVTGLPFGRHQNDNLTFGPDGFLYIGVGSTCDACVETDPRSATIMRFDPVSGEGEIYATGMRNPYDLAFHPETRELFATDNGRDDLGMDAPREELNRIVEGGDYGWPGCWGQLEGPACANTIPAVAFFEAHSSANSLDFYFLADGVEGGFPNGYTNSLFVAVFGSWLKAGVETGIARVSLPPTLDDVEGNVTWFARWEGMPLGLVTGPDGALYVGDYVNGAIYRISYGIP